MEFFDTHAHLADPSLSERLPAVLEAAHRADVRHILCVGTTAQSSQRSIEIARNHRGVYASVGIHPNYAHQATDGDWREICQFASDSHVVALGETGLDRYWDDAPWEIQLANFHRHWELSRESRRPVIVHCRDCEEEMVVELRKASDGKKLHGVMHSFAGSWETAEACLELELYISFAGMVTYKKSGSLREVAAQVPIDRLLIETDAPYLSPEPKRAVRPNEPALIVHTAACIAQQRGMTLEELAEQTTLNAKRLFQVNG